MYIFLTNHFTQIQVTYKRYRWTLAG